jgi:phage terminase large subunit-like protein
LSELSVIESLRSQKPPDELRAQLKALKPKELLALAYDWDKWARPSQKIPTSRPWANWLIKAGRGFGKTRTGSETIRQWVREGYRRCNIIVRTVGDIEKVLVKSSGGILNVCPPAERPIWTANKRLFQWPNGATSFVFTAEEPDSLRGPEAEKLWCDELASWRYDRDTWDMANFGLRLGNNPQAIITTTPRPTKLIRELLKDPHSFVTAGTTYENRANLADRFFEAIIKKYEGTRLGRQELNAELLDDNPGALFHHPDIEGARVQKLPPLVRVVVALDPAVTSNEDSDEWGIVAAGMDGRDPAHFYTLADESEIYSPDDAAKQAVRLFQRLAADRVIGEANNGGDMIEALLRNQETNVPYHKVTASRGKVIRAEPVAALYEQGRVHHHGMFAKLEDEMTNWNPQTDDDSPNRMDALVWAITELAAGTDGWIGYARSEVAAMEEKGIVVRTEERINVAGENRDICECGSKFWLTIGGEERCLKCQAPRPK